MFRSDFRKNGVCSKSVTKLLYRNKVLVKWMHFQISLSLRELQIIRDWLCVRDIAETSLNRLLLLLILKSSHRSCSVEKSILKNFTEKRFCWSLFLIKLQGCRPSGTCFPTHVFSTEIFKNIYFKNTCIFM